DALRLGVDHRYRVARLARHVDPPVIRADRDAFGLEAHGIGCGDLAGPQVDPARQSRVFIRYVDPAAVRAEREGLGVGPRGKAIDDARRSGAQVDRDDGVCGPRLLSHAVAQGNVHALSIRADRDAARPARHGDLRDWSPR